MSVGDGVSTLEGYGLWVVRLQERTEAHNGETVTHNRQELVLAESAGKVLDGVREVWPGASIVSLEVVQDGADITDLREAWKREEG